MSSLHQKAEEWIGTREASRLTGYTGEWLRLLANAGKVKSKRVATIWVYEKNDLLDYRKCNVRYVR